MQKLRVVVAVTGHRDTIFTQKLKQEIEIFFDKLFKEYKEVILLSPLADGADRLVCKIFLEKKRVYHNAKLEIPMPFLEEIYKKDFTKSSSLEFVELVKYASKVYEVPKTREHPYVNLGEYIVKNSDILLALWDKKINHKLGGTADVVLFAKSLRHKIEVIDVKRVILKV